MSHGRHAKHRDPWLTPRGTPARARSGVPSPSGPSGGGPDQPGLDRAGFEQAGFERDGFERDGFGRIQPGFPEPAHAQAYATPAPGTVPIGLGANGLAPGSPGGPTPAGGPLSPSPFPPRPAPASTFTPVPGQPETDPRGMLPGEPDLGVIGGAEPQTGAIDIGAINSTQNVMRSSGVMALGTAVSRILGFVRAAVLVWAVQPTSSRGPGLAGDAFSVANMIPNALYILLAGGVLNAVLVPQITRAAKRADGGQEYIDRLLTAAISILIGATLLVTLAAPLLVRVYSSANWPPEQRSLGIAFAFWCLPQVFGYGLYTILGQVLNARGSFGPFTWAPVVNNIVAIGGLLVFIGVEGSGVQPLDTWSSGKITLLAGTATLGVLAQALILIPAMGRAGISFTIRWGLRGFGLRTASRVAGWTFAAIVVQQLGLVVISQVTTTAGDLANTVHSSFSASKVVYDNAFLLFMLPHSLVAVSLVTALFTRMSSSAAQNRIDDVRADLSLGLRLCGLATVLSAAAFLAIGPEITAALFPLSPRENTLGFAYVAMAMMVGLVPFSAQYLFQRVFYAFEDAKTPFLIQVPVTALWAAGNGLALVLLRSHPQYIVIAVGGAMAVSNALGAALSYRLLHRRFGDLDGPRVLRTHVRMITAAVAGGVTAFVLTHVVHAVLGDGKLVTLLAALLGGTALVGIYVLGLRRLHVTELDDVLMPLLRRKRAAPAT